MKAFLESTYPATSARGAVAPEPSDYIDARSLAANAAEVHAIPAGARFVSFSANGDFFARFGNSAVTASIPGDVTNGSAAEMNPGARRIPSGATHIALIAASTCLLTLSFYGE